MIKSIVKIASLLIWITSCNHFNKPNENIINEVSKDNKLEINKDKQNYVQIREGIKTKETKSYFNQDTFYIICNVDSLIIKQYFKLPENNPGLINKVDEIYIVEQKNKENYLFVSIYLGDATPYKSYLIDFKLKKIIIETDFYQTYIGCSNNGLYHLFEGGTSGGIREFAIFNSKNKLLKKSSYYSSVNDTNQLKWQGNKIYYFSDIQERFLVPDSISKLTDQFIYVQKYEWKENIDYVLNEFMKAYIE